MSDSKKTSPQKKLSDAFQFLETQPAAEEQKPKRQEASTAPESTAQKHMAGPGQMSLPMTELLGGHKAMQESTRRPRRRRRDSSREEVPPAEPVPSPVEPPAHLPSKDPPEPLAVPREEQIAAPSTMAAQPIAPPHPLRSSNGSATGMPPATSPVTDDVAPHPPPETTPGHGQDAPLTPPARPAHRQLPEQEMMQQEDQVWEMLWPVLSRRGDETVRRLVAMQRALKSQEALVRQTTERLGQIARAVESVASELERGVKIELIAQRRRVVDETIQGWTKDLGALGRHLNQMMLGWSDVMATSLKDVKRVYAMIRQERQAMETRRARARWGRFWAALAGVAIGGLVVAVLVMTEAG